MFTKLWLQAGPILVPFRPRGRFGAPLGGPRAAKGAPGASKPRSGGVARTALWVCVFNVFFALGSPVELK